MKYITYEEPLKGKTFTENQMHEVYRDLADKTEYPENRYAQVGHF